MKLKVTVNGVAYDVDVDVDKTPNTPMAPILFGGGSGGPMKASGGGAGKAGEGEVPAPLAGTVAKILVAEGDAVKAGQVLLTLEAMKMETEINAPADGTVKGILGADPPHRPQWRRTFRCGATVMFPWPPCSRGCHWPRARGRPASRRRQAVRDSDHLKTIILRPVGVWFHSHFRPDMLRMLMQPCEAPFHPRREKSDE